MQTRHWSVFLSAFYWYSTVHASGALTCFAAILTRNKPLKCQYVTWFPMHVNEVKFISISHKSPTLHCDSLFRHWGYVSTSKVYYIWKLKTWRQIVLEIYLNFTTFVNGVGPDHSVLKRTYLRKDHLVARKLIDCSDNY